MWWRRLRTALLLLALSTMATCPIGVRACRSQQRSAEARKLLGYLVEQVQQRWRDSGAFPPRSVGPTPSPGACCDNGGACSVQLTLWDDPAWRALRFTIDGAHRYAYSYQLVEGGAAAIVRATGDLDCDGSFAVFEARLVPDGDRLAVTWTSTSPTE
jgi:hypothetical protein